MGCCYFREAWIWQKEREERGWFIGKDGVLSFVLAEYKCISSLYFMVKYRERFIVRDSMRKVMLIHNSVAGMEKRFIRQREDILTYLSKYFDAIEIKSEEELSTDCARRACKEGFDSIVAIGGDGTLDAVVAGMAEEEFRPKLCFLPGGTFNLICRMMGLPMNLKRALHRYNFEKTVKMHVGKANDRYFSFILSIGVLSEEIHNVSRKDKKTYGALAYAVNVLKALPAIHTKEILVSSKDLEYHGEVGHLAYILNQNYIYFRDGIFNKEDYSGGLLMLTKDKSVLTALPVLATVLAKQKKMERNTYMIARVDDFDFETPESETEFDLDGDLAGKTPVHVQVLREHLDVYLPKKQGLFGFFGRKS